jgi:hypothetical protein
MNTDAGVSKSQETRVDKDSTKVLEGPHLNTPPAGARPYRRPAGPRLNIPPAGARPYRRPAGPRSHRA